MISVFEKRFVLVEETDEQLAEEQIKEVNILGVL